jgi:hypothetical protein
MTEHAARVLRKMKVAVPLTDEERAVIERQADLFDGTQYFFECKKAFLAGDYDTATARLEAARKRLQAGKVRLALLLILLRTAPAPARVVYRWWHSKNPNP